MGNPQQWALTLLLIAIFTSACTTTKLTAVWNDDTYAGGPMKKIMVVAALDNPVNRKIVESALVEELKQYGAEGIASNMVLGDQKPSETNVIETAKQKQVDGLMALRLTGVDEEQVYHPPTYSVPYPYYYTWDTYYPYMHEQFGMPGYTATYKYYNVETNVYSASTEKLVWSAASQTVDPTDINKEAREFARKIVRSLKDKGLI
jgi:hypothetical protein